MYNSSWLLWCLRFFFFFEIIRCLSFRLIIFRWCALHWITSIITYIYSKLKRIKHVKLIDLTNFGYVKLNLIFCAMVDYIKIFKHNAPLINLVFLSISYFFFHFRPTKPVASPKSNGNCTLKSLSREF